MMNHVRGVELGKQVFAKASLLHKGKLSNTDVKITDEEGKLVSYGKHTTIITKKKNYSKENLEKQKRLP